jgi:hypothetical protein
MSVRSLADVIQSTRQAIGTNQTMITISFTGRKLTMINILPKGHKFDQLYLLITFFPI